MSVSRDEFEQFKQFGDEKLGNGGVASMRELLREWETLHEATETISDVRESLADVEAGRTAPATEVFNNVRKRLGLTR